MRKLIFLVALLWALFASAQAYHGYVRLGKLSQAQIDAIDVSDTSVIYTAYNTDNAREEVNLGAGWVARFTPGAGGEIDFLSNVATDVIIGRNDPGSGDSEELTPAEVRTMINVEDGATADLTGSEIEALLDAALGNTRWKIIEVPSGGTAGQVLKKATSTDYDYSWEDDSSGSGGFTQEEIEDFVGALIVDSPELDFTYTDTGTATIEGSIVAGSIDETKMDVSVNISLGLADTSLQPGGPLGTPSSGTATNLTGLPVSTGISGLGTGVATFLATPSSANFAAALTGETGTGAVVMNTTPNIINPVIQGSADQTKQLIYDFGPQTTGTSITFEFTGSANRVIQFPNSSTLLAGINNSQTFTNKTINAINNTITGIGSNEITDNAITPDDIIHPGTANFVLATASGTSTPAWTLINGNHVLNASLLGEDLASSTIQLSNMGQNAVNSSIVLNASLAEVDMNATINASLDLADTALQDLIDDASPQLADDLDAQSNNIDNVSLLEIEGSLLADTEAGANIGSVSLPFFETHTRRLIIQKTGSFKDWRFDGNNSNDDLDIAVETTAGSETWTAAYAFPANGVASEPTHVIKKSELDAAISGVSGGTDDQTAAEVPSDAFTGISATNVQAALEEIKNEAGRLTGTQTWTNSNTFGTSVIIGDTGTNEYLAFEPQTSATFLTSHGGMAYHTDGYFMFITDDSAYPGALGFNGLTGERQWDFPDASGTVALLESTLDADNVLVDGSPSSYTPAGTSAQEHFEGIDAALSALAPGTAPFTDGTAILEGSADDTKLLRIEVDGFTTGTTKVWTAPDEDIDFGLRVETNTTLSGAIPIYSIVAGDKDDIDGWASDPNRLDVCLTCKEVKSFIAYATGVGSDWETGTTVNAIPIKQDITIVGVYAMSHTAPAGSTIIVDINEDDGTPATILSTKLSIDAGERTSASAASAAVISDASIAAGGFLLVDIDQAGSSTAGSTGFVIIEYTED